jgi:hypothetical protein
MSDPVGILQELNQNVKQLLSQPPKLVYTYDEVTRIFSISERKVVELIQLGHLEKPKDLGRKLVTAQSLYDYVGLRETDRNFTHT